MEIKIIGKELKITDAINDYVEKKLDRINKYFENATADVTVRTERERQIAEITVSANGDVYRAVTEDKDLYASIDKDIDILEGQIRKAKTKRERQLKDSTLKVLEVETPKHEVEDEILKIEYYEIKQKNTMHTVLPCYTAHIPLHIKHNMYLLYSLFSEIAPSNHHWDKTS